MPKDSKSNSKSDPQAGSDRSRPILHQHAHEIQPYGKIAKLSIGLDESVCAESAENLNQVLADTITLRDLYKKHHWQVAGHTFYQLHLLFDKHYEEQNELVDSIAERIQSPGPCLSKPTNPATTVPTTCWSVTSSGPTSCKSGSSPNISWMFHSCTPTRQQGKKNHPSPGPPALDNQHISRIFVGPGDALCRLVFFSCAIEHIAHTFF